MTGAGHTAVGQALGYLYQFDRATYHLLSASSAVVSVGIEHLDDVSVHQDNGTTVREQNKATIGSGGPLTDRSPALWKTIAIWAEDVLGDPKVLCSTEFHLVTNGTVRSDSVAARIHAAKASPDKESVATELLSMAEGLRLDLQPFATKVLKVPPALLASLVGRMFVFGNVAAPFGGNLEDLETLRLLGPLQRTAVFDNAAGWVRRTVLAAAQAGRPTLIDREAFDRELRSLFRRVNVAPLAVVFEADDCEMDPANFRSCGFFQQLDWIDTEPSFVRECVIDYVRAQATRVKWTDAGEVSESSLRAYERDLKKRWKLHVQRQSLRTYTSPVAQGQDLLVETLLEDSTLDGQAMPKFITCGSFHALADFDSRTDPEIGWHPEFGNLAKDAKGGP